MTFLCYWRSSTVMSTFFIYSDIRYLVAARTATQDSDAAMQTQQAGPQKIDGQS